MDELKERFYKIKSHKEYLEKTAADSRSKVLLNESNISKITDALDFLYKFSEFTRNEVKTKLETLSNLALSSVFTEKKMQFKVIPNRNKKGLFYDLYIDTDGNITPLEDCKGGGVLDIISLCLRISYLRIFKGTLRQVLILDEPFKNLDDVRRPVAIDWLATTAKEMNIQMIIVTHLVDLIEKADKAIKVEQINGISKVYEIDKG
jgi:DNA repair exonuclease SbcCD ATPase subunit